MLNAADALVVNLNYEPGGVFPSLSINGRGRGHAEKGLVMITTPAAPRAGNSSAHFTAEFDKLQAVPAVIPDIWPLDIDFGNFTNSY